MKKKIKNTLIKTSLVSAFVVAFIAGIGLSTPDQSWHVMRICFMVMIIAGAWIGMIEYANRD